MSNEKEKVTFFTIGSEGGFERIDQEVEISSGVETNYHPENYYG